MQHNYILKQSTADKKVQKHSLKKLIHYNLGKEKKCIFTCAESFLRPRSLTPAWASSKTCPLPFSSAQEKHFFQSQLCSLIGFCHSFPISRSTEFPGRFLTTLSLPPQLWVDFNFFFSVWLLLWAEQSAWTESWVGLLLWKGRRTEGRGPVGGTGPQQLQDHPLLHLEGSNDMQQEK